MKLFEIKKEKLPSVETPSCEDLAKKHNVDLSVIKSQLKKGIDVEYEHTTNKATAKEIALDHINEDPKYYDKLKKVEEH